MDAIRRWIMDPNRQPNKVVADAIEGLLTKATAAETSADNHDSDITTLQADITALQTSVATAQATAEEASLLAPVQWLDPDIVVQLVQQSDASNSAPITAAEALSANTLVNLYAGGARKADDSLGYEAHGWVSASYAAGETATVYFSGTIEGLTGLSVGPAWLSTAGGITQTPPAAANYSQIVGVVLPSGTGMVFAPRYSIGQN